MGKQGVKNVWGAEAGKGERGTARFFRALFVVLAVAVPGGVS